MIEKATSRRLLHSAFGNLEKCIQGIYLYHPELYLYQPQNIPLHSIPLLSKQDENLRNILNRVFDYHTDERYSKARYIFFEESFSVDNEQVGDLDLVRFLAETLNKNEMLIKRHPRSIGNPYQVYGLQEGLSSIPWELIQMNEDISNKVLLTISSGSVLSSALYFGEPVQTYILYKCLSLVSPMNSMLIISAVLPKTMAGFTLSTIWTN